MITGSMVLAAILVGAYVFIPALSLSGSWWSVLGIVAAIVLIVIYINRGNEIASDAVLNLGLAGFGYVTGFRLLVVSVAALARQENVGPFSQEDLSLIAISGLVVMLVSYKAASEAFRKAVRS